MTDTKLVGAKPESEGTKPNVKDPRNAPSEPVVVEESSVKDKPKSAVGQAAERKAPKIMSTMPNDRGHRESSKSPRVQVVTRRKVQLRDGRVVKQGVQISLPVEEFTPRNYDLVVGSDLGDGLDPDAVAKDEIEMKRARRLERRRANASLVESI